MHSNYTEKSKTILIVDDTPENIDLLNNILKNDYIVKIAIDGKNAIAIASSELPDLILLDIIMPDINGYEVCRQLKEQKSTCNIPVIFVTVKDEIIDEELGFSAGAVDYITKPVVPSIVKARVKTHISLKEHTYNLERLVTERTKELVESYHEIIKKLGRAVEYKDNQTGLHVNRMGAITLRMGQNLGLSAEECDLLYNATLIHDIGKIGIPDNILLKPGKLTESEWAIMKKHTSFGAEIIGETTHELLTAAKIIALTHHEKWDGSGYPRGLKGEEIPLFGRIVAIADVFDALTHTRPYKEPWSVDRALDYIKDQSGRHFDPALVPVFIISLEEIISENQLILNESAE